MKLLPQLDRQQLNEYKEKMLGNNSKKFPESFLFEQLFVKYSPLSQGELLSERIKILMKKYRGADITEGLKVIFPDILKYLLDNGYIDEDIYEQEYDKCSNLVCD